ncbi:uncharacterized protein JCM6883_004784 [Sporobolomyces salmoneus]|uniref:uncharacterized protein n=1 Tax=Sporobolomyces salmoneus TaxID=183962 RepID=UPI00316D5EC3
MSCWSLDHTRPATGTSSARGDTKEHRRSISLGSVRSLKFSRREKEQRTSNGAEETTSTSPPPPPPLSPRRSTSTHRSSLPHLFPSFSRARQSSSPPPLSLSNNSFSSRPPRRPPVTPLSSESSSSPRSTKSSFSSIVSFWKSRSNPSNPSSRRGSQATTAEPSQSSPSTGQSLEQHQRVPFLPEGDLIYREGGEEEEELESEEPMREWDSHSIPSTAYWRSSPRRDQMIDTAECDEYVRIVQWENGW